MDTAHLVADETAGRETFYVGMSRGRARNTAYVIRDRARIVGTAESMASATCAERTPRISDPEVALLAGELVRAMDERAE